MSHLVQNISLVLSFHFPKNDKENFETFLLLVKGGRVYSTWQSPSLKMTHGEGEGEEIDHHLSLRKESILAMTLPLQSLK